MYVTHINESMTSTDEKNVVNSHSNEWPYTFGVNVKERQDKLPTMYMYW